MQTTVKYKLYFNDTLNVMQILMIKSMCSIFILCYVILVIYTRCKTQIYSNLVFTGLTAVRQLFLPPFSNLQHNAGRFWYSCLRITSFPLLSALLSALCEMWQIIFRRRFKWKAYVELKHNEKGIDIQYKKYTYVVVYCFSSQAPRSYLFQI